MPKMKSKRAACKRFVVTGSGKLKHKKSFRRHLLASKSSKRARGLAGNYIAHSADLKKLRRLFGLAVAP